MEITISEDVIKVIIQELEKRGYKVTKPTVEVSFPQYGDKYYYIKSDGDINWSIWDEAVEVCWRHRAIGNIYRTEEDAKFAVERLKVIKILKEYEEKDPVWDGNERHYYIRYESSCDKIDVAFHRGFKVGGIIYFRSMLDAMTAVEKVGDERIKKYYLGVAICLAHSLNSYFSDGLIIEGGE